MRTSNLDHPKTQTDSSGALLLNFGHYGHEVEVAAVAGDGRRVLTVHDVGVACVWEVDSGRKVGEIRPDSPLRGTEGMAPGAGEFVVFIESAALNRDGSLALLGLNDGTAGVFAVEDGRRLSVLHVPETEPAAEWSVIRAVAYSPDGNLALVGFPSRQVGVWSEDGRQLSALLSPTAGSKLVGRPWVRDTLVSSVAASPDAHAVFAGCADMTASVWDRAMQTLVLEATEHAEQTIALFDAADGFGWATTGGSVWRCGHDGGVEKVLDSGEHWSEVAFHGNALLARSFDGAIARWMLDGERTVLFPPSDCPSGRWADNASTLGFRDEDCIHYPEGGQRLVARVGERSVAIERDSQLVQARFAPTGDSIFVDGWRDVVEQWSLADGSLVREFPCPGTPGDFDVSLDGRLVAIGEIGQGGGFYPRSVLVYDVATGKRRLRLVGHDWQVSNVRFSPDGRWLASIGREVLIWDLARTTWFRRGPAARLPVDRVSASLKFLRGAQLLVVDSGGIRLFCEGRVKHHIEVPVRYGAKWCVSEDEKYVDLAITQGVTRVDLELGEVVGDWLAPIPRPERLAPSELAAELGVGVRGGAALWRTPHGTFVHQGDGPRGWVEPLSLSPDGHVVLPAKDGAVVLNVTSEARPVGRLPFEGKMRTSRVVGSEVVLVNEKGQVFRGRLDA